MSRRRVNNEGSIYEYPAGSGKWHVRFILGRDEFGKVVRVHRNARNRTEATKIVNELKKQRDSGSWQHRSSNMTVAAILDDWLENVASRRNKPSSIRTNRNYIENRIKPAIGEILADSLTVQRLDQVYNDWMNDPVRPISSSTARKIHAIISSAFSSAKKRNLISRDVTKLVTPPDLSDFHEDPFTLEEMTAILNAASRGPRFARWLLAFHCGLRQGECLGLRWRDIDLEHGFVVVRSTLVRLKWEHGCPEPCGYAAHRCPQRHGGGAVTMSPKSGEPRIAPLTPALVEALQTHAQSQLVLRHLAGTDWIDNDYVFTNERGEPLGQKVDYNAWLRLLHEAGVRRARLHNARHSSGTLMGSLGVPLRDIQGIFGHSSPKVTERYVHVLPTNLKRAADLVHGAFTLSQGNLAPEPTATKSDTETEAGCGEDRQNRQSPHENESRLGCPDR